MQNGPSVRRHGRQAWAGCDRYQWHHRLERGLSGRHRPRRGRRPDRAGGAEHIERRDHHMTINELFTTETSGIEPVRPTSVVRLRDGDRFDLHITPVRKNLSGADLRMLAYNGSIPGPTLHVDQGSEITVQVCNDGDVEATVHWHGLRLETGSTACRTRPRRRFRSAARLPTRSSSRMPDSTGTNR